MKQENLSSFVKAAIVCALYVAVTLMIAPIASGPIQFRVSELFNFLAFYNRRYIGSVTVGCAIANLFVSGSLGIPDVLIGSLSTLVFVTIGVFLFQNVQGKIFFLEKRFLYFSLFFAMSMFTIAGELAFFLDLPFFYTWLTVAIGEFLSLLIGSWVVHQVGKRVDLTK